MTDEPTTEERERNGMEKLAKFISRRIALGVGSLSTVVGVAMEDGVVTQDEFWGIVMVTLAVVIGFALVDSVEKGNK
jgi:hypothetical protein